MLCEVVKSSSSQTALFLHCISPPDMLIDQFDFICTFYIMARRSERIAKQVQFLRDADEEVDLLIRNGTSSDKITVVCLPPEAAIESDLEDVDEDELGDPTFAEIAGDLEVHIDQSPFNNSRKLTEPDDEDTGSETEPEEPKPATRKRKAGPKTRQKRSGKPKPPTIWTAGELAYTDPLPPNTDIIPLSVSHPELQDLSPLEVFQLYFNKQVMELILTETNRYIRQKNRLCKSKNSSCKLPRSTHAYCRVFYGNTAPALNFL